MQTINDELFWELNRIGIALTAEKNVDDLLDKIVLESMRITNADGGSLYIRINEEGRDLLRFKIAKNLSRDIPFKGFAIPLDRKSIAGFVASSRQSLQISDVDAMPPELGFRYNASFDYSIEYRTINMLVVPMIDYKGNVVGVLQLVNKKRERGARLGDPHTIPDAITDFSGEEERIVRSLASQAAMLIERAHLYEQLKLLPFSFIDALISALEARDSFSSGHSRRVATCSRALAEAINQTHDGMYQTIKFSTDDLNEIYYAGLLHDIGKIGVSEAILLKNERISTERARSIRFKFLYMARWLLERSAGSVLNQNEQEFLQNSHGQYDRLMELSRKPKLSSEDRQFAESLYQLSFDDWDGRKQRLLDSFERDSILADEGRLTSLERDVMELHVTFSYDLLRSIRWPETLLRIPAIVKEHHERLDGSGYPDKLSGNQISVAGRVLAIADRFDNLACKNRHAAHPLDPQEALEVLRSEGTAGRLDAELVSIFDRANLTEREEITRTDFEGGE